MIPSQILLALLCIATAFPQSVTITRAPRVELPPVIDGNSAAFWSDGVMHLFHSTGVPHISSGPDQFNLGSTREVIFDSTSHSPVWFEAVWRDQDGTLFLFYHHEPELRCPGSNLTAPKIGAAISHDNGATVQDLGIVLESGDPIDCNAKNGFFSGGHGDASVILDREHKFFYFFFTNYAGATASQGVATARMAFEDRMAPAGKVQKFYMGQWNEPGLGGKLSPIFPANRAWQAKDTDSPWGPSIHYNTHLDKYVILLNRSCCKPGWPQAGIDITFNSDLSDPFNWKPLQRILYPSSIIRQPGYYPQILGLEEGHSDHLAGQTSRLYLMGISDWEITFDPLDPEVDIDDDPCYYSDNLCPSSNPPDKSAIAKKH